MCLGLHLLLIYLILEEYILLLELLTTSFAKQVIGCTINNSSQQVYDEDKKYGSSDNPTSPLDPDLSPLENANGEYVDLLATGPDIFKELELIPEMEPY